IPLRQTPPAAHPDNRHGGHALAIWPASRQPRRFGVCFSCRSFRCFTGVRMPSPFSGFRRSFLSVLCAAMLTVGLTACGKSQAGLQDVHGIDLSGASFGDGFQLKDPDGRVRTLEDFKGKVVLMFFGFTQCPDVCPTALVNAAQIKSLLGADGDKLQM